MPLLLDGGIIRPLSGHGALQGGLRRGVRSRSAQIVWVASARSGRPAASGVWSNANECNTSRKQSDSRHCCRQSAHGFLGEVVTSPHDPEVGGSNPAGATSPQAPSAFIGASACADVSLPGQVRRWGRGRGSPATAVATPIVVRDPRPARLCQRFRRGAALQV